MLELLLMYRFLDLMKSPFRDGSPWMCDISNGSRSEWFQVPVSIVITSARLLIFVETSRDMLN
jgi:hypothetical protein